MKITRDVVYDLLPGYFAGEVSADTRALIDEFLTTDPEFSRMTARFKRLFDERGTVDAGDISTERNRLERDGRQRNEGVVLGLQSSVRGHRVDARSSSKC